MSFQNQLEEDLERAIEIEKRNPKPNRSVEDVICCARNAGPMTESERNEFASLWLNSEKKRGFLIANTK